MQIIQTINDVKNYAAQLAHEGINFHPDTDFNEYVNVKTDEKSFTLEEAANRNNLMENCFKVCKDAGVDIYNIMNTVFLKETGLDKIIGTYYNAHTSN